MRLCECPRPARDTGDPDRRFHCAECDGWTAYGRRAGLDETLRMINMARSYLDRLRTDLTYAHTSVYGLQNPTGGTQPKGSHSDPTFAITGDQRAQGAQYALIAGQLLRQALGWLVNADEAAGHALYACDPHRGPADHTRAAYHDTFVPTTGNQALNAVHEARARRHERGEL